MRVAVDGQCLSAGQIAPSKWRFVWQMLGAFAHSSGGVEMETLTFDHRVAQALRLSRIRARRIDLPPPSEGLVLQTYAQRVNVAYRTAWLDSPPDIILLPELISPEVAFIEPFGGIPIVAVLSGVPREATDGRLSVELAMKRIERLREANAWFLVASLRLRDWLSAHARIPAERIETLPPPVDLRRFTPSPGQASAPGATRGEGAEPFVLTLACKETRAGLRTVFRAFGGLSPSLGRTRLVVAADQNDLRLVRAVQRMAAQEGLAPERWRLADEEDRSFAALLHAARIFVYPAEEDYIAAPLLQAMAAGCAVLCSESGALPELAGTAALTGSLCDVDELRERLARFLRQHAERESWASRGPARAKKYGARQCAARLVQTFYQEYREEAPLSGDLRVAYVSPFPPTPTAAAQYSRWLAGEVREYADVDLYASPDTQVDPVLRTRFQIFPPQDLPNRYSKYDVVVYNMGGELGHYREIFGLLTRCPGVVILHDVSLFDFFHQAHREQYPDGSRPPRAVPSARAQAPLGGDPLYEEMVYCYGAAGAEAARRALLEGGRMDRQRVLLNNRIAQRSRGVVVHSRWAARRLLENGAGSPILSIPHGAQVDPQCDQATAREFRESLRSQGGRFLIGAAGHFDSSRRLGVLFQTVARLKALGRQPILALLGSQTPDIERAYRALADRMGIAREIVWLDVAEPYGAFLGRLAALDVIVNLRHPTVGEVSELSMTALALGKPLVVSDTPVTAELPPAVAFRIKPDDLEVPALTAALEALGERADLRAAMGEAARRYIAEVAAWPVVARRFCQFLYEVARRYAYVPPSE